MGAEDSRGDRMELGLGLWTDNVARYYPLTTLRDDANLILDELDSRPVLIVFDDTTGIPAAYYVEAASAHTHAGAHGAQLHFDNGLTYSAGVFHDADGDPVKPDRPLQLFTRWYGFSFTFPACEIYEP